MITLEAISIFLIYLDNNRYRILRFMVKIRKKITSFLEKAIEFIRKRETDKLERLIMNKLNIPDKPVDGEKEYNEYWKGIVTYPMPSVYRLYSRFCGHDRRIVSETAAVIINSVLNPARFEHYATDKNTFSLLLPGVSMPRTIFRRMDGLVYDESYNLISNLDEATLTSNLSNINSCVLKPTVESNSGNGVQVFHRNHNDIVAYDGTILTSAYLLNYGKNWILQESVKQSEYMAQFNPSSVNTLRISTYKSVRDDKIHILSGVIRMGSKGAEVDNSHAGGRMVRFDKTGVLANYCVDQYAQRYPKHNDIDFSDGTVRQIPEYEKIVRFAKDVADRLKLFRLLQLDIAIDENNNPLLIEFNCSGYSERIAQRTGTPAFGKWTDEIVEYVKTNRPNTLYLVKV